MNEKCDALGTHLQRTQPRNEVTWSPGGALLAGTQLTLLPDCIVNIQTAINSYEQSRFFYGQLEESATLRADLESSGFTLRVTGADGSRYDRLDSNKILFIADGDNRYDFRESGEPLLEDNDLLVRVQVTE